MSRPPFDDDREAARRVADSLAQLFESDFPDDRAAAEEELRESGIDPQQVGRQLKQLAETALAGQTRSTSSAPQRRLHPGAAKETLAAHEPANAVGRRTAIEPRAATDSSFDRRESRTARRAFGSIAAIFVVFVLGYVLGRNGGTEPSLRFDRVPPATLSTMRSGHAKDAHGDALDNKLRNDLISGQHREGRTDASATPDTISGAAIGSNPPETPHTQADNLAAPGEAPRAIEAPHAIVGADVITTTNVDEVKTLISPGVEWCVRHGMQMQLVRYKKIMWNTAYREATEKYGGQTKLAPDGRTLVNYVAGMPFPNIDPNDPQVALKIMWNYEYKPYVTDDEDLRNFEADTGSVTGDGSMRIERHFRFDHLRSLAYNARLYVDPKPELPNPDEVRGKSSLHPFLEPFDLKGVGFTTVRYLNPDRQDDTWLYLPDLRRVRRLSSAQRSDALFGQDFDFDSLGGFAGQVPWFDWKYLGERDIVASFHSSAVPTQYCQGAGDFIFCDRWERRRAYVVEGVPKLPQYAYGKRLLFIDQETYLIAYSDIYDRSGQLWKALVNQWSFKKRATPSSGFAYEDEMPFNPSVTMVDMQSNHATRAALPSPKFPDEQGWSFNQGSKTGLSEEFFTVSHLIESGH